MREAFDSDSPVGEVIAQSLSGGFWNSLTSLAARVARASTMSDETAAKLSEMLMSRDPAQVASVVKLLEDRAAEMVPKAYRAGAAEYGTTTGITSSMWPDPTGEGAEPDIEADLGERRPTAEKDNESEIERALRARRQNP
jgi:hypothetical protein